jgi:peptidoglycan/xylan/chitin deacetylase (PgdA/CDA1 family)
MLRDGYHQFRRGFRHAVNRAVNRFDPPILVLLYHRIADPGGDRFHLCVSPDNFRQQLKVLKERFTIARFGDDWRKLERPAVVVTFDDGYADNLETALPILESENVPAAFFLATATLGTRREFWWDELERTVFHGNSEDELSLKIGRSEWKGRITSDDDRHRAFAEINALLRAVDVDDREAVLTALRSWAEEEKEGRTSHRPLTWDEVSQLARHPLATIGAHTRFHCSLGALSVDRQREEIDTSRRDLEQMLDKKIEFFAFPFGGSDDYTLETIRLCQSLGIRRAATAVRGQIRSSSDPLQIPRAMVRNWDGTAFSAELDGFLVD